jgi:hypothetical protein
MLQLNYAVDQGATFNNAVQSAMDMVNSERARVDGQLMDDFAAVLRGNCFYFKEFVCKRGDLSFFERLGKELAVDVLPSDAGCKGPTSPAVPDAGDNSPKFAEVSDKQNEVKIIPWSKHQLIENPTVSETFNAIIDAVSSYFDLDVYQTRLNYYPDTTSWKPFHHDSHAYGGRALREDFTVGISLGGARELAFLHPTSKRQFSFPQENGDVFAFTNEVNQKFMHGVPRATGKYARSGPRLSLIAWGRRRSLNERNGGQAAPVCNPKTDRPLSYTYSTTEELGRATVLAAQELLQVTPANHTPLQKASANAPSEGKKEKKKNRLQ